MATLEGVSGFDQAGAGDCDMQADFAGLADQAPPGYQPGVDAVEAALDDPDSATEQGVRVIEPAEPAGTVPAVQEGVAAARHIAQWGRLGKRS